MGRKRFVPILVGSGKEMEKVLVHTEVLTHPYFIVLLELAAIEFGYDQQGILRIPCNLERFQWILDMILKTKMRNSMFSCLLTPVLAYRVGGNLGDMLRSHVRLAEVLRA
ncbi:hypothetical protein Cni_G22775 [Canna indica]|uniref:Small auxin up regulated protein n=1 Tax=Canna indica TaxID=4628 RepID=A0AAQ3QMY9_9LILI|nr:hypothetical protein Cni_G22775 [Canna indica]